jgi:hypothetical protein
MFLEYLDGFLNRSEHGKGKADLTVRPVGLISRRGSTVSIFAPMRRLIRVMEVEFYLLCSSRVDWLAYHR